MIGLDVIIRQIIDVDKKADGILTKTEEYIRDSDKNLKANIEKMKEEIILKAKSEAVSLHDSILNTAKEEADRIAAYASDECSGIEAKFLSIRDTLEENILSKLFQISGDHHD